MLTRPHPAGAQAREAAPIGRDEAIRLLQPLAGRRGLLLAVSGGPDSVALMRLAALWHAAVSDPPRLLAATVDHGLRAGSGAEAETVRGWAEALGLEHVTLSWEGPKPVTGIQAEARRVRYSLLAALARARGLEAVVTAHQREDQAETFLLRLARGSGVGGLAAIREESRIDGMTILRPLLAVPRARLAATLAAFGQPALEDPTNADPRFARARLRALAPALAAQGLTAARLAATAARLARAEAALAAATDALVAKAVRLAPNGTARMKLQSLIEAPEEIRLRVFARAAVAIGRDGAIPRLERLEALAHWACERRPGSARTLAGARFRRVNGDITVIPEAGRAGFPAAAIAPGVPLLWDGRFRLDAPPGSRASLVVADRSGAPVVLAADGSCLADCASAAAAGIAVRFIRAGALFGGRSE